MVNLMKEHIIAQNYWSLLTYRTKQIRIKEHVKESRFVLPVGNGRHQKWLTRDVSEYIHFKDKTSWLFSDWTGM